MLVSKTYKAIDNVMGQIREELKNLQDDEIQEFFEDLQFALMDEANLY
jgi:hypothetical protein